MNIDYIINKIPAKAEPSWVINYLAEKKFSTKHVLALKEFSKERISTLSEILSITPKTFGVYSKDISKIKIDTKEHILLLLSLMKRGAEVFEDRQEFSEWLNSSNVFFDNKQPIDFLNTISGIKFIDSRLTAMEYGDNI